MIGILLAGGTGTRSYPATSFTTKHFQLIYDKPLFYYPLCTLIELGFTEIIIIAKNNELKSMERFFGNGFDYGLRLRYIPQHKPKGIPEAFLLSKEIISGRSTCLILGDNIFGLTPGDRKALINITSHKIIGSHILSLSHQSPQEYGVIETDSENNILSIEEKPTKPKSNNIIPGLYFFDSTATQKTQELAPSKRGEIEIVDLIKTYRNEQRLGFFQLSEGCYWVDAGSPERILSASNYVQSHKNMGYLEKELLKRRLITKKMFDALMDKTPKSTYKENSMKGY